MAGSYRDLLRTCFRSCTYNGHKEYEKYKALKKNEISRIIITEKNIDPEKREIQETSENFITIFLKGALIKIKENNPNLSINYTFFKSSDKVEYIHISNLSSIEDYDLITDKIRELLAC